MPSHNQTLPALSAALNAGHQTSVALTEKMLANATDPAGQGSAVFTRVLAKQALAQAAVSDQLRAIGQVRSPIEGIPVSVKDLFDVQGYATRAGSTVLADAPPAAADATIVRRLRAAGAILIGTTNMTEFAYSGLGINPHHGTPLSPWDRLTRRIPGGSSSGAAVSVTDAMAAAAIGSDTGGSVRIPSAFCGLTGFKPTARRIDMSGALPLSTSLDSIGPLARSVTCCAWLDAILAGQSVKPLAPISTRGLVFGLPRQLVMDGVDDTVADTFGKACERLKRVGVKIEAIDIPELADLAIINAQGGFTAAEAWAWHADLLARKGSQYDPRVSARIRRGESISARDFIALLAARQRWIDQVSRRLLSIDALIMPTVPVVPPPLQPLIEDDALYGSTNLLVLRNPTIVNFLDGCALSLPCHAPGQAPVGLMLAAVGGADERLLRMGMACESALAV